MNANWKKIAAYFVMPQVLPRLRRLSEGGFSHISFFMAQIFSSARLLPPGHPYLFPDNMGRYGLRHVFAEARRHLVIDRKHIDQVFIFTLLTVGLIILMMQFFLFGAAVFMQTAAAAPPLPTDFAGFFVTPDPQEDVALNLLDRIFGVPGVFNTGATLTNVAAGAEGPWPSPFHLALHGMLQTYSVGLLAVGMLIFLYFVVTTILETAHTGTPFGRRFNHLWAPLRMVMALGLLVPLASGLNAGQYIALYAAKYGSGFATNAWFYFNDTITGVSGGATTETILGNSTDLIAEPELPPVNGLMQFMSLVATCHTATEARYNGGGALPDIDIQAYLVNPSRPPGYRLMDGGVPFSAGDLTTPTGALQFSDYGNIDIWFGYIENNEVVPKCGKLRLPITDISRPPGDPNARSPGSHLMQAGYYNIINALWSEASTPVPPGAISYVAGGLNNAEIGEYYTRQYVAEFQVFGDSEPEAEILQGARDWLNTVVDAFMTAAATAQAGSGLVDEALGSYGWGGAGIFYNRVSEMNGRYISAVYHVPFPMAFPEPMMEARRINERSDENYSGIEIFKPASDTPFDDDNDKPIAEALYYTFKLWADNYSPVSSSGSIVVDFLHTIFGTRGLFNIHENIDAGKHPLAVLSAVGKSVMDSTITNVFAVMGGAFVGTFANFVALESIGTAAFAITNFAFQIAMLAMVVGFVLFYIVPFLPFIYFFFAVGGWVKGLFEAMVGVPLWALAHIKIDGNGLPGDAALGGYFLILEIFLRPILIVFGLLASVVIFSAQVLILEDIWKHVISNAVGFDAAYGATVAAGETGALEFARGMVDQFFYLVIFTIIIYLLAMASFKMVDMIPNEIMRWMGQSVQTFGDQATDPAENLVRNTFIGGRYIGGGLQQAMGGAKQTGSSISNALGSRNSG